ncbi:DNA-directed RNA polymerase subunit beta [Bacillus massiliglaciei]|uniref:DNA-directed RNA polymerase subunit beta n=1 Tax=Bacillus massiliglaciei TaxID=1816693 RepID=UPI000DA60A00|nr:DNA-directed RNA polymerase subunit beta [Bacillus massiliglaciei]
MEQKSLTRQQFDEKKNEQANTESRPWIRVRLLPIWLRLILICLFAAAAVVLGAIVGYSVFGGGEFVDVFKKSTWTHIVDIVNQGT